MAGSRDTKIQDIVQMGFKVIALVPNLKMLHNETDFFTKVRSV